jgi:hypothetical protein
VQHAKTQKDIVALTKAVAQREETINKNNRLQKSKSREQIVTVTKIVSGMEKAITKDIAALTKAVAKTEETINKNSRRQESKSREQIVTVTKIVSGMEKAITEDHDDKMKSFEEMVKELVNDLEAIRLNDLEALLERVVCSSHQSVC